eukprot:jgi/Botrbrau1/3687/Bobra.0008s0015.2
MGSCAEVKEPHKIFDEVIITVRSGKGGKGEVISQNAGKFVKNYKYKAGGQQPKQLWLPAAEPADGWDGADVLLVADPGVDSLLHLHERRVFIAEAGSNANPADGSGGPRGRKKVRKQMPALKLPVPLGTVVKRKRGGQLLADLVRPGQMVVVARGGLGGSGAVQPTRSASSSSQRHRPRPAEGVEEYVVEDKNWEANVGGGPGEEVTLSLLLRVVADVGIVGLPNAGKSSLLAVLTRARPEVAPYPFTTLMPNLGVMAVGRQDEGNDLDLWEVEEAALQQPAPVLADLPGLIEGAHIGRGLGRMFLRHLRRTRELLHVVDASSDDPGEDYAVVRQELLMYNPEYCARPHIVALNKVDLLMEQGGDVEKARTAILNRASGLQAETMEHLVSLPEVIVATSAVSGTGIVELATALRTLRASQDALSARLVSSKM